MVDMDDYKIVRGESETAKALYEFANVLVRESERMAARQCLRNLLLAVLIVMVGLFCVLLCLK